METLTTGQPTDAAPALFTFGIGIALEAMLQGHGVARCGWNGKGLVLHMQLPDPGSKMTLPYIYIEYPADATNTPGARVPWLASQTDLLAKDWVLVGPFTSCHARLIGGWPTNVLEAWSASEAASAAITSSS